MTTRETTYAAQGRYTNGKEGFKDTGPWASDGFVVGAGDKSHSVDWKTSKIPKSEFGKLKKTDKIWFESERSTIDPKH